MTAEHHTGSDWAGRTEQRLLDEVIILAPQTGWAASLPRAAARVGLSPADVELLVPGGARDLAALLSRRHDARALAMLGSPEDLAMRERIRHAVEARMDAAAVDLEAARKCQGFLLLPTNATLGLRLAWESADVLWNWSGDAATDENHYSKRTILSGILIGALSLQLNAGRETASRFVDNRIDQVIRFERWKANLPRNDLGARVASALGAMRYPR